MEALPIPTDLTQEEICRFWAKVRHGKKCWTWQASKTPDGYGKFRIRGTLYLAHRIAYTLLQGPIPEGKTLDHTCHRLHCCNPKHMEVISQRVNTLRGKGPTAQNAKKKRCKRGHLLEGDNVIERVEPDGVRRRCRICYRERKRKAYAEGKYR